MLWYVDGNFATLHERGCSVPSSLQQFQGYNQPELRKKRKRDESNLKSTELEAYSNSLFTLASSSYFKTEQWKAMHEVILRLADNLRKYVAYLQSKNTSMQEHHGKKKLR